MQVLGIIFLINIPISAFTFKEEYLNFLKKNEEPYNRATTRVSPTATTIFSTEVSGGGYIHLPDHP